MTIVPDQAVRLSAGPSLEHEISRLSELLVDRSGSGTWWAAMAQRVESLSRSLWEDRGADGIHVDITTDEPRLVPAVRRLEQEHEVITTEIAGLRALISRHAGDRGAVALVVARSTEVIAMIRAHQRRTRDAVHEAWSVDLGGGE
jgi:hypothetical protein